MFERFTERARQVVVLAQDEARALRHNYIGTEHLLLGLMREEEGLAARVLESLDITIEEVRAQVARIIGQGEEAPTGQVPFTPRAKKVLELALREALSLSHNYIGTEHLLLGLARENQGVAMRILLDFGADAEKIRNEVIRFLSGPQKEATPYEPKTPPVAAEVASELERLRKEKEVALEAQEFEQAATLRARERRVAQAGRMLEAAWRGDPVSFPRLPSPSPTPRRATEYGPAIQRAPLHDLLVGWGLGLVSAGLGVLVGWAIWG